MINEKIKVSIVIKALNEEEKIASTIESALCAIEAIGGEVILADSHSADRTVEIASRYPIRIVQLNNPKERSCGVGGQLGYQESVGEYIWIVDGDMELSAEFITSAISALEKESNIAGVSGNIVEKNLESLEFRARVLRAPENLRPGIVDRLDGGGVYRRSAIESVQYFTNRNLHSYEEYELAARLRSRGWLLKRIPVDAAFHYGHKTEAFSLLLRRWDSGYITGIGELIRSALGNQHFSLILREVKELRLYTMVIFWWLILFSILMHGLFGGGAISALFMAALFPVVFMLIKKRSFVQAIYSVVSWNFYAAGLIKGFFRKQLSPFEKIDAKVI